jgi:hypothetical protein
MTGCLKGDHQYVALLRKKKKKKMGQINTRKTNGKRRKDLRLATWNVQSLYIPGGLRITINELRKYKIAIAAIQETRWNSRLANNHEFGKAVNFPTKLIRLTKATLIIVTCCVKIQNDCYEPFRTRQGLSKGDV